jgi:hypothetical protein
MLLRVTLSPMSQAQVRVRVRVGLVLGLGLFDNPTKGNPLADVTSTD